MPHDARVRSATGYYHVVPKGLGDRLLFENDSDRRLYIELLGKTKERMGLILHAYCLMSNHAHLIVEDVHEKLSESMKFLHEQYAASFAKQTGRTGGVFRKPYWSEPIESDSHLLCAVRYVHANPHAAGICAASTYDWSSVKDYLGRDGITDTQMVLSMLGGREGFIQWSKASNTTGHPFPGSKLRSHLSDEEASRVTKDILGFEGHKLASFSPDQRVEPICRVVSRGISVRQLVRVTGLGKWQIQDALARG